MEISSQQIRAARAGDPEATAVVLRLAWPNAYRIAWSILQERTSAEDAAQDACAQVLSAIGNLRQPERFAPWFYRIVVNEAKRRLRYSARHVSLEPDDGRWNDSSADLESVLADRIDVRRAMQSLEPDLRLAIVLRYFVALSSTEIARIVGTSPITVRWRLMLARRRLRVLLGDPHPLSTFQPEVKGTFADEPQTAR